MVEGDERTHRGARSHSTTRYGYLGTPDSPNLLREIRPVAATRWKKALSRKGKVPGTPCRCGHTTIWHDFYHQREDGEWEVCWCASVDCVRKERCDVCECMNFTPAEDAKTEMEESGQTATDVDIRAGRFVLIYRDPDGEELGFCSWECMQKYAASFYRIPDAKPVRTATKGELIPDLVCRGSYCQEFLDEYGIDMAEATLGSLQHVTEDMPLDEEERRHGEAEVIEEWATAYLHDLQEWQIARSIARDYLFLKECYEHREVAFYLPGQTYRVGMRVYSTWMLAQDVFMTGMMAGARLARTGLALLLLEDTPEKRAALAEWANSERLKGQEHCEQFDNKYIEEIRKEEGLVGYSRATLAAMETERDSRAMAYLEWWTAQTEAAGLNRNTARIKDTVLLREIGERSYQLVCELFKTALVAGARAHVEGYLPGVKR